MAVWIRDGFEYYNAIGDAQVGTGYGMWDTATNYNISNTTQFSFGHSIQPSSGGGQLRKAGFPNAGTIFIGCRFLYDNTLGGTSLESWFTMQDGSNAQFAISFRQDGAILFYSGTTGGTVIATYTGAFLAHQWNQYQFKIVVGTTTGEVHVRKNGNTVDDFSATGLNTQGGTANAFVNVAHVDGNTGVGYTDDLAIWDTSGLAPWNNWMGDFRAIPLFPTTDNSIQFATNNGASTTYGSTVNTGNQAVSANTIRALQFTADCGGLLGNLTVTINTGYTGHLAVALYDSDGAVGLSSGQPGTLLASCTPITNPVTGANTCTWVAAPTLQNGHTYFIALWSDVAFNVNVNASGTPVNPAYTLTSTYSGTFPASLATATTSANDRPWCTFGTISITSSGMVNDIRQDGATTYVSSATVGQTDWYGITSLPYTPSNIWGLDQIIMVAKSDAGARGVEAQMKSSATTLTQAQIVPNTTFNYFKYQQDTDPATGSAWTAAGVNNLLIGQTISL